MVLPTTRSGSGSGPEGVDRERQLAADQGAVGRVEVVFEAHLHDGLEVVELEEHRPAGRR